MADVNVESLSLIERRQARELLAAMGNGDVRRTSGGLIVRETHGTRGGTNRCDPGVKKLVARGWAEERPGGRFKPTDAGEAALAQLAATEGVRA